MSGGVFCYGVLDVRLGCIRRNGFVGWCHLGGDGERGTVLVGVGAVGGNDAPEVVCVLHQVVLDFRQNYSEGLDNGGYFVVGQLTIDCGEYLRGLFEGKDDLFGRQHGGRGRGILLVCLA